MTDKPKTIEQLQEELKLLVSCIHYDLTGNRRLPEWEERTDLENYEILSFYLRDVQEIIDKILVICEEKGK